MVTQQRATTPQQYQAKVASLKQFWQTRDTKFQDWYKTLRLDETSLRAPQMEAFVSNDPKTLYSLALYLLTPEMIPHNIPNDTLSPVGIEAAAAVEDLFLSGWSDLNREVRSKGRQSWLRYLVSLMLATGWFSVMVMADDTGFIADIWNPAEVYPEFSDGLSAVAHTYQLSGAAAIRRAAQKGWTYRGNAQTAVTVVDYWEYDQDGVTPVNTILYNSDFVKSPEPHPEFTRIPVLCSPVGGLPDNGAITQDPEIWKESIGESIIASNQSVYRNYDRQLTFLQQILRDTAQPKFKERSRTGTVLDPANIFKRGAIFKMDVDEDVGIIDMPSIPPELRTQLFDIQNMLQRGGFPYSLYGNVQGDIAAFAMSQITAAASQVLQPFREAVSNLLTDIDNIWLDQIITNNVRPITTKYPQSLQIPPQFPPGAQFKVDLKVQVPGDLVLRATTARQLDPEFALSSTTVMDLLFKGEIRNPNRELASIRRDQALKNPVISQLDLIAALRAEAEAVSAEGNGELANLYTNAANMAEQQFAAGAQALLQPGGPPPPSGPTGPAGQANILPQQIGGRFARQQVGA